MSNEHTHTTSDDDIQIAEDKYVSWSTDTDEFARKNAKQIIELMERHRLASRYYKRQNDIFQISLIVVSGLTSIITVIPDSDPDNPWSPLRILGKVTNPVLTLLTVLNKYFNFGQKMEQHTNAIKSFRELLSMLQTQLVLPLEDRIQASKFIPVVMKQLNKIMSEYPELPASVERVPINIPDEMDTDNLLKIHKEEEQVEIPIDPLTHLELAELGDRVR